jgi:hypothetical protein
VSTSVTSITTTNPIGSVYNWLAIGVGTHGGMLYGDPTHEYPNFRSFVGPLADLRIYNRPLSGDEVKKIFGLHMIQPPGKPNVLGTVP